MSGEVLLDLGFLTDEERDVINGVIFKDVHMRKLEQSRISRLRKELGELKENGLPEEDLEAKNERYCARCQTYFGIILNKGALCPRCEQKVCKICRNNTAEDEWMCTLCYKVREVKAQSGAWFFQDQKGKNDNLFGSLLLRQSLRRLPGSESRKASKERMDNHKPVTNGIELDQERQNNVDYNGTIPNNRAEKDRQTSYNVSVSEDNPYSDISDEDVSDEGNHDVTYSPRNDSERSSSKSESDTSDTTESDHEDQTKEMLYRFAKGNTEVVKKSKILEHMPENRTAGSREITMTKPSFSEDAEGRVGTSDYKQGRQRISMLDETAISYTPLPKFSIPSKRRGYSDNDDASVTGSGLGPGEGSRVTEFASRVAERQSETGSEVGTVSRTQRKPDGGTSLDYFAGPEYVGGTVSMGRHREADGVGIINEKAGALKDTECDMGLVVDTVVVSEGKTVGTPGVKGRRSGANGNVDDKEGVVQDTTGTLRNSEALMDIAVVQGDTRVGTAGDFEDPKSNLMYICEKTLETLAISDADEQVTKCDDKEVVFQDHSAEKQFSVPVFDDIYATVDKHRCRSEKQDQCRTEEEIGLTKEAVVENAREDEGEDIVERNERVEDVESARKDISKGRLRDTVESSRGDDGGNAKVEDVKSARKDTLMSWLKDPEEHSRGDDGGNARGYDVRSLVEVEISRKDGVRRYDAKNPREDGAENARGDDVDSTKYVFVKSARRDVESCEESAMKSNDAVISHVSYKLDVPASDRMSHQIIPENAGSQEGDEEESFKLLPVSQRVKNWEQMSTKHSFRKAFDDPRSSSVTADHKVLQSPAAEENANTRLVEESPNNQAPLASNWQESRYEIEFQDVEVDADINKDENTEVHTPFDSDENLWLPQTEKLVGSGVLDPEPADEVLQDSGDEITSIEISERPIETICQDSMIPDIPRGDAETSETVGSHSVNELESPPLDAHVDLEHLSRDQDGVGDIDTPKMLFDNGEVTRSVEIPSESLPFGEKSNEGNQDFESSPGTRDDEARPGDEHASLKTSENEGRPGDESSSLQEDQNEGRPGDESSSLQEDQNEAGPVDESTTWKTDDYEGRPGDESSNLRADEYEERPGDEYEESPGDQSSNLREDEYEEKPGDEYEESPGDQSSNLRADEYEEKPGNEYEARPDHDDYEARPGDEYEERPGDEYEARPGDEYEARPGDEYEARPGDEYEARPGDEYEARPGDEYEARPGDEYEARPGDEYEARPGDEYEARPGDEYEARPGDEYEERPGDVSSSLQEDENEARPGDESSKLNADEAYSDDETSSTLVPGAEDMQAGDPQGVGDQVARVQPDYDSSAGASHFEESPTAEEVSSSDTRESGLHAFSQTFTSNEQRDRGRTPDDEVLVSRPEEVERREQPREQPKVIITTEVQPATKSNRSSIVDYEEDSDVSFSKYEGNLGNRMLKDQLSMGSRESIMSYYSNAGGEVYGKYPVNGDIYFGIKYDAINEEFQVQIHQARDITAVDEKHNLSDPYVKTYLLPDTSKGGKRKSKVKKRTINPVFDEIIKYKISYDEILQRTLWLAVWNYDRFGHNDFLGEVLVPIDQYQQSGFRLEDPEPQWYHLCERQAEDQLMTDNGEIVLALKYVPPSALVSKTKKKKKKGEEEKGELHVNIIEANNLLKKDVSGFSDPFCKSYLLPDKSKKTKQKTAVVKKNINPKWNYRFVYDNVTHEELMDRVLELTVWDYDRGSSNDFLGGVRIGLGAGLQEWDDANSDEQAAWNKMLNNQNDWNQVTLTLRDHMGNHKRKSTTLPT